MKQEQRNRLLIELVHMDLPLYLALCEWAYLPNSQALPRHLKAVGYQNLSDSPTSADLVTFQSGGTRFFILAGTTNPRDWWTNIQTRNDLEYGRGLGPMKKHRGFVRNGMVLMARIEADCDLSGADQFVIAGHSQGAAVAADLNVRIIDRHGIDPSRVTLVTVAEPASGMENWVRYLYQLEAEGLRSYRFLHELDPVPTASTIWAGFQHKPEAFIMRKDGALYRGEQRLNRFSAAFRALGATIGHGLLHRIKYHSIGAFLRQCGIERLV